VRKKSNPTNAFPSPNESEDKEKKKERKVLTVLFIELSKLNILKG